MLNNVYISENKKKDNFFSRILKKVSIRGMSTGARVARKRNKPSLVCRFFMNKHDDSSNRGFSSLPTILHLGKQTT